MMRVKDLTNFVATRIPLLECMYEVFKHKLQLRKAWQNPFQCVTFIKQYI